MYFFRTFKSESRNVVMASEKEERFMFNTGTPKLIGFYRMASSHASRAFGVDFYRSLFTVQLTIMFVFICVLAVHVVYARNDVNNATHYLIIVVPYTLSAAQLHCVYANSDRIWNCVRLTSSDNLAYGRHDGRILGAGKTRSKFYSLFFVVSWIAASSGWWLSPFAANSFYFEMAAGNGTSRRYRFNVLNLVLPVTDKFYNDHYAYYYAIECLSTMVSSHGTLLFETLLIMMGVTIAYQLKTIANSYGHFTVAHAPSISRLRPTIQLLLTSG